MFRSLLIPGDEVHRFANRQVFPVNLELQPRGLVLQVYLDDQDVVRVGLKLSSWSTLSVTLRLSS